MNSLPLKKKKNNRSVFYRLSAWLHLWLGIVTGIIMVIVCLTGCIWVFSEEINSFLEPEYNISRQGRELLKPSKIIYTVESLFPEKKVSYITFRQDQAAYVAIGQRRGGMVLRVDPYTGKILSDTKTGEKKFDLFRFILSGHRYLWMPPAIGRPVVNYSTLIFVFLLITGMVLWWPKKWNKSNINKSFKIKWNGKFKRINYDVHNVLGFYSLIILFAISCTGMVYGIEWFSKGLYWTTSGGESLGDFKPLQSDSSQTSRPFTKLQAVDVAWNKVITAQPSASGFYMTIPDSTKGKSTIYIVAYPTKGKFYDMQTYTFDRYSVKQLKGNPVYESSFSDSSAGAKIRKMNYDIHIGSVLGLPGKILAFFASLIGASLPITGFIIWLGKKKNQPAKYVKNVNEKKQAIIDPGLSLESAARVNKYY